MFQTQIRVRFNHVDAAGIVFYPRYYEMLNQVVEEWFEAQLDSSFKEITVVNRTGVPAVSIHAEFTNPSRLGDDLDFKLRVEKLGTSSMHLVIEASCQQQPRLSAKLVLVYIASQGDEKFGATPIPDALRQRIQDSKE